MNEIEQTILSIKDIAEHREDLRDELYGLYEQEVDDMLVRFAMTFSEAQQADEPERME